MVLQHWFDPDRTVLLVNSQDGLALWNTATLTLIGTLVEAKHVAGVTSASFDASGRIIATATHSPEGFDMHVVIWDVSSLTPVGQCLMNGGDTVRLASDGRTVLGAREKEVILCRASEDDKE